MDEFTARWEEPGLPSSGVSSGLLDPPPGAQSSGENIVLDRNRTDSVRDVSAMPAIPARDRRVGRPLLGWRDGRLVSIDHVGRAADTLHQT